MKCKVKLTSLLRVERKVDDVLRLFEKLAKHYPYVWEIGFSGGKDSTTVCSLVLEYLDLAVRRNLPIPSRIYFLYIDTLVEPPILRDCSLNILSSLRQYIEVHFPRNFIDVRIIKPIIGEDYFSMIIEKGYPCPNWRFRWCMDRLKIRPLKRLIHSIGKCAMITGVRKSESISRKRNMIARGQKRRISQLRGNLIVAPIFNWTDEEVWNYLANSKFRWSKDAYSLLRRIYECSGANQGVRYGCWVCTVVRRDRMLEGLSKIDSRYRLLLHVKEKLRDICYNENYRLKKSDGAYTRLNNAGKRGVIKILYEVYKKFPEALSGYLTNSKLRDRLMEWIASTC